MGITSSRASAARKSGSSASSVSGIVGGSCLCGGVRFEVELPFRRANVCHCSRCRKHSGAGGLVQGRVAREQFRLLAGAELLRTFRPDAGKTKVFCAECGSSLFGGDWPDGEISVRLGSLDGDPGIRPEYHTYVDSKAVWDELPADGLPRYAESKPGE
jgi:hypothetical protein